MSPLISISLLWEVLQSAEEPLSLSSQVCPVWCPGPRQTKTVNCYQSECRVSTGSFDYGWLGAFNRYIDSYLLWLRLPMLKTANVFF